MRSGKAIISFQRKLDDNGVRLTRGRTNILQVNVGLMCNQVCKHCHLDAGPNRPENMNRETAEAVVTYARACHFNTVDITGGAPEMNPNLPYLIEGLSEAAPKVMLRSNLTALAGGDGEMLIDLVKAHHVGIVASLPSINELQADSQRGKGIFQRSLEMLRRLNAVGYGKYGSGFELNLVSNPTGAFLPPSQEETEKRFRTILKQKHDIIFNHLYSFANVPLGRYRDWLIKTDNFEAYMDKLVANFNLKSVDGLMCRSLVSVSWDGYLFDCDFNLTSGLFLGGKKRHVLQENAPPLAGSPISVSNICYTCTAGAGFT